MNHSALTKNPDPSTVVFLRTQKRPCDTGSFTPPLEGPSWFLGWYFTSPPNSTASLSCCWIQMYLAESRCYDSIDESGGWITYIIAQSYRVYTNKQTNNQIYIITDSTNIQTVSTNVSVLLFMLGNARKQDSEHVLSLLDGYRGNFLKQTHVLQPCTWIFRTAIMKRRDSNIPFFGMSDVKGYQKHFQHQPQTPTGPDKFLKAAGGCFDGKGEYVCCW